LDPESSAFDLDPVLELQIGGEIVSIEKNVLFEGIIAILDLM
jgi:hypothetical protein